MHLAPAVPAVGALRGARLGFAPPPSSPPQGPRPGSRTQVGAGPLPHVPVPPSCLFSKDPNPQLDSEPAHGNYRTRELFLLLFGGTAVYWQPQEWWL